MNAMPPTEEDEAITRLSREFIAHTAPQELPLFRAVSEIYLNDPARLRSGASPGVDKMLGFGSGELLDLITPIVLVVVGEVVRFAVREFGAALKKRNANDLNIAPLNLAEAPAAAERNMARVSAERARLRDLIDAHFSLSEIENLCFEIGVDFEGLSGAGKLNKARELVAYCARQGRLVSLIEACQRARPFVAWAQSGAGALTAEQLAQIYEVALLRARDLKLADAQAALLAGALMDSLARSAA